MAKAAPLGCCKVGHPSAQSWIQNEGQSKAFRFLIGVMSETDCIIKTAAGEGDPRLTPIGRRETAPHYVLASEGWQRNMQLITGHSSLLAWHQGKQQKQGFVGEPEIACIPFKTVKSETGIFSC